MNLFGSLLSKALTGRGLVTIRDWINKHFVRKEEGKGLSEENFTATYKKRVNEAITKDELDEAIFENDDYILTDDEISRLLGVAESAEDFLALLAESDVVTLGADIALNTPVNLTKDLTIEMNGQTITGTADGKTAYLFSTTGAKLTLKGPGLFTVNGRIGLANEGGEIVVESGTVETKSTSGEWGEAGTYLHLVLANATEDDIYINVGDLIEYVTSGSQAGDMVFITIDPATHKVTASITDGTITKAKLHADVQASLDKADSAVQSVTTGENNGEIKVDGNAVPVKGLKSAAYQESSAFDAAGAADNVLGTDSDSASAATVYGVKKYASDAYNAIKALTDSEIETLIQQADTEYENA